MNSKLYFNQLKVVPQSRVFVALLFLSTLISIFFSQVVVAQDLGEKSAASVSNKYNNSRQSPNKVKSIETAAPVIVIDPGHGGEDFGAIGVGGLLEKDLALLISSRVRDLLQQDYGIQVKLTRESDHFKTLAERTAIANDYDAAAFISIHMNASEKKNLSGLTTFYLDNSNDAASLALAERENQSLNSGDGPLSDLQLMLSDVIQSTKLADSIRLAHAIQSEILKFLSSQRPKIKDLGVRKAPFYVLVGAHMPCVLVELFFIDHPDDSAALAERTFREKIAQALAKSIAAFISSEQKLRKRNEG